jgi:hypothetical protein
VGDLFMKLQPVISIISGVIITIIFFFILGIPIISFNLTYDTSLVIIFVALVFGGFTATYFTGDQKIEYSIPVGIIISFILLILGPWNAGYVNFIFIFTFFSIASCIGGLFGKFMDEIIRKISKMEYKINNEINSKTSRFKFSKTQNNMLAGIIIGSCVGLFLIGSFLFTSPGPDVITIQSSGFSSNLSQIPDIYSYSTVKWINNDTKPHRIISDYGWFDSGNISPGQSYSHNFYGDGLGNYHYHDTTNLAMKGNIQVYIPTGE